MVVDENVPVVVMLVDLTEDKVCKQTLQQNILCFNHSQSLCQYWPEEGRALIFGEL